MNDKSTIFAGLAVFVVLVVFPIWHALLVGGDAVAPELELPDPSNSALFEKSEDYHCVERKMVARHIGLLDQWRDAVVRGEGQRQYHKSEDFPGKQYEMSLTKTCMGCHTNRETFCYRCHEFANVLPFQPLQESAIAQPTQRGVLCWDCHIAPKPKGN